MQTASEKVDSYSEFYIYTNSYIYVIFAYFYLLFAFYSYIWSITWKTCLPLGVGGDLFEDFKGETVSVQGESTAKDPSDPSQGALRWEGDAVHLEALTAAIKDAVQFRSWHAPDALVEPSAGG